MLWRQQGQSLVVRAPAKLNLFLEVLGKRSDGYHELETLMVSVNWYDTLSFTEDSSRRIKLRCFQPGPLVGVGSSDIFQVPGGRNNLVVQTASLFCKYVGIDRGVQIDLLKQIPVAAGLAGGSSDAAATLVALNRFWRLGLTHSELHQLASQIGSDIGFFLTRSSMAICRGRGEIVEPLSFPLSLHFVIARPATGLSTAAVYEHFRPSGAARSVGSLVDCMKRGRVGGIGGLLHNSLQSPAEQLNAEVKQLKRVFSRQTVLGHQMTGSGTAYFGLCGSRRQARAVAARLKATGVMNVSVVRSRP